MNRIDDRGVSIAVTHVLTLGITAALISGLLLGAGSLLDGQTERSERESMTVVGERVAGELASVDRLAEGDDEVRLEVDHPSAVSGTGYEVVLRANCDDPEGVPETALIEDDQPCLTLTGGNAATAVPVSNESAVATSSVSGGSFAIVYDGEEETLRLEEER